MPDRSAKPLPRHSEIAKRVGLAVRMRRVERVVSLRILAELASLSKDYVANIERGEYEVTVSSLKRLVNALGCRAAILL